MLIIIAESSRKRPKLSHHPVNAGLVCSRIETSRCASPITTMLRPHGNALLTSSICGVMALAADTRDITRERRSPPGASRSKSGSRAIATSMSTSTMIKKAPRQWTHWRCFACWPASGSVLMASRRVLQQPKGQLKHQAMLVLAREQERNRLSRLQVPSVAAEIRQDASRNGERMQKGHSSLFIGGLYALTTAALLATQAPFSFLAAKQLSVAPSPRT